MTIYSIISKDGGITHLPKDNLPDMDTAEIRRWLRIYGKTCRMNPDIVVSLIDKVEELQNFITEHADLHMSEAPRPDEWRMP